MAQAAQTPIIEAMLHRISAAGVYWPGGRRFELEGRRHPVVVGRVCDDEPLIHSEVALGRSGSDRIVRGLGAVALLVGAHRAILAVNAEERELLQRFQREAEQTLIEVVALPPRAPLDRASLLCDLADLAEKSVPAAGLERALVLSAPLLSDLALALEGQYPLRRMVSVAGAVAEPCTLRVPLGTPLTDLVAACGGCPDPGWVAWHNGVLAGQPVDRDHTVDLDTRGLVVLPRNHDRVVKQTTPLAEQLRRVPSVCVNCRLCSETCPTWLNGGALQPHRLMATVAQGWPGAGGPGAEALAAAALCNGCGVCDTLCPASLRPSQVLATLKLTLARLELPAPSPAPLGNQPHRAGRRQTLARLTARCGLLPYHRGPGGLPGQLIPETLRLALVSPGGARRAPLVEAGQSVGRGDVVAMAAAGSNEVDLRAPAAGRILAVDPDDGVVLQVR